MLQDQAIAACLTDKAKKWFSRVFAIVAYGYVAYILLTYRHYSDFFVQFQKISSDRIWWLGLVLFLLPFNILAEALKWKRLVRQTEKLSLAIAVRAVLAGFSTGFFSPNRIAEPVGRVMFLQSGNRKLGIVYSVLNSMTQNIVMLLGGLPALILFLSFVYSPAGFNYLNYISVVFVLLILFAVLVVMWQRVFRCRLWQRYLGWADDLKQFGRRDLLTVVAISSVRYVIFCAQMFAMLRFLGVDLFLWQALLSIPASYLLVTVTPAMAFSELAVRSSYAVLFVGAFVHNPLAITLSGLLLWIVNFGMPMLAGVFGVVRK
jgi:hypothetical protein